MTIQILPPNIRDQIAAGEVVERPASVIKELLENSLDAKAKNVEIWVDEGGRKLIRVKDDGQGMCREDAEKSILRHATSKIRNIDDLFAINSFGFRGEALAAIAAISNFELVTKISSDNLGTKVAISGGENLQISESSANDGTDISIRDLFFPTPARLQYLKSEATEYRVILKEIHAFSLANPEVGFKLYKDGKLTLDLPAALVHQARVEKILRKKDLIKTALGFVGRPENCIANKNSQYLFVNGRRIEDFRLAYAVREAYNQSCGIEKHLHPVFVLFLQIDPILVDVNVHPRKLEVKFSEPRDVFSLIQKDIFVALSGASSSPSSQVAEFSRGVSDCRSPLRETPTGRVFSPQKVASSNKFFSPNSLTNDFSQRNFERDNLSGCQSPIRETLAGLDCDNFSVQSEIFSDQSTEQIENKTAVNLEDRELGELTLIGQTARKYILAESADGLFVFDQHALHERQRFEMYWEKLHNQKIPTQNLLVPQVILMSEEDISILHENQADLLALNFGFKFLADDEITITEVPSLLGNENLQELFESFVEYFQNEKIGEHGMEKLLRKMIEYKACRGAIMFGDKLERVEMEKILADLSGTKFKWLCAHGRPNYMFYPFEEFEKGFHR